MPKPLNNQQLTRKMPPPSNLPGMAFQNPLAGSGGGGQLAQNPMMGMWNIPVNYPMQMRQQQQHIKQIINETVRSKQLEDKVKGLEMLLQEQMLKQQLLQYSQSQQQ